MRRSLIPLALVVSLAASSAMAATSSTAVGVVKALDAKACTVTLGTTVFHFAAKCDLSKIKVGEKVEIWFRVVNKVDDATKIAAATAATTTPKK
ncbi:MAG TPA: hypothetical protein VHZ56_11540 [Devosia sp.]|nr:hypothetical protein [Devosia sp.]